MNWNTVQLCDTFLEKLDVHIITLRMQNWSLKRFQHPLDKTLRGSRNVVSQRNVAPQVISKWRGWAACLVGGGDAPSLADPYAQPRCRTRLQGQENQATSFHGADTPGQGRSCPSQKRAGQRSTSSAASASATTPCPTCSRCPTDLRHAPLAQEGRLTRQSISSW